MGSMTPNKPPQASDRPGYLLCTRCGTTTVWACSCRGPGPPARPTRPLRRCFSLPWPACLDTVYTTILRCYVSDKSIQNNHPCYSCFTYAKKIYQALWNKSDSLYSEIIDEAEAHYPAAIYLRSVKWEPRWSVLVKYRDKIRSPPQWTRDSRGCYWCPCSSYPGEWNPITIGGAIIEWGRDSAENMKSK